jgi:antirestriction protein ArdC
MLLFDLYQTVTDQIVAMLEAGVVPWRSPILGRSKAGHPRNLNTGKQYRGVNVFLLAFTAFAKGYGSSYWLTFNQAKERDGTVKKGEKSSMVVFWKQYDTTDKETGQRNRSGLWQSRLSQWRLRMPRYQQLPYRHRHGILQSAQRTRIGLATLQC